MAKDFSKAIYKSGRWQKCRKAYIAARTLVDGGLCEECHDALGYIVHHKILLTAENINDPEIVYSFDNLEYVCKQCHDQFEGHGVGGKSITALIKFDDNGDPIPPLKIFHKFLLKDRGWPSEKYTGRNSHEGGDETKERAPACVFIFMHSGKMKLDLTESIRT